MNFCLIPHLLKRAALTSMTCCIENFFRKGTACRFTLRLNFQERECWACENQGSETKQNKTKLGEGSGNGRKRVQTMQSPFRHWTGGNWAFWLAKWSSVNGIMTDFLSHYVLFKTIRGRPKLVRIPYCSIQKPNSIISRGGHIISLAKELTELQDTLFICNVILYYIPSSDQLCFTSVSYRTFFAMLFRGKAVWLAVTFAPINRRENKKIRILNKQFEVSTIFLILSLWKVGNILSQARGKGAELQNTARTIDKSHTRIT